ncbi:hypothetical protein FGO68_gene14686 [Halteria grandinella]|uniref:Uncharacterized protein n=1 Tax=Halteria grandinella TaxID=5974 RepID=A0A8J8NVM8_HALGN|nr:hypothetical protein FGO68_gene14686 [Halteria grandinella]
MSNNQCGGDDDFVGDKRNSLNPLIYGGRGNLQREEQWGGGIDEILRVGQGKNRFGLRLRFFVTVHIRDSNLKPNICLSEVQENTIGEQFYLLYQFIGDLKRKIEWEFEEIHKRKIQVEEIFVSQVFPINENNVRDQIGIKQQNFPIDCRRNLKP